ncbi:MAG: NAD+ synthase [Desulfurococcaceae archaeon]|nr:NAD+ synthase [Desulfurococcaceae archaeon]
MIDVVATSKELIDYIRSYVDSVGVRGVVLGVSGGADSATTAALAVKALGPERVYALILPDKENEEEDIRDAELVTKVLGLKNAEYIDITGIVESFLKALKTDYDRASKIPKGNIKARVRMVILYYYANIHNLLVVGSSDRSEYLLGFFTKWGDGAADIYPLINLYKTQVRLLAEYLGIPEKIAWKPSSPGFWRGHKARDELGADYDVIDRVLYHLIDLRLSPVETAERVGVPLELVYSILRRVESTEHKRRFIQFPPKPTYIV